MKENLSVFGITQEIHALDEILAQSHGEVDESYEKLSVEIENFLSLKTDNCVGYVEFENSQIDLARKKISELQDFIRVKQNKLKRFEDYIRDCIERTGRSSFDGELHQIKLRKPAQKVIIKDQDKIPFEYIDVQEVVSVKKKEIKDALKHGEIIEGAELETGQAAVIFSLKKGSKK